MPVKRVTKKTEQFKVSWVLFLKAGCSGKIRETLKTLLE